MSGSDVPLSAPLVGGNGGSVPRANNRSVGKVTSCKSDLPSSNLLETAETRKIFSPYHQKQPPARPPSSHDRCFSWYGNGPQFAPHEMRLR
ncbi:Uncharacterized protein HZ326_4619 [Fusarium oxysporum f. sp. albedinis]|nr:Uncharacterized protein HZ326_4619 [Fusarium oxysporum f. sp. albedinis]